MSLEKELLRKIDSLKKIVIEKKPTKPYVAGEKLLILATAPSVRSFFEYDSVQKQFDGYDIAAINFMLAYSEKEMHFFRPKYFVLIDSIFFLESARKNSSSKVYEDCRRTFDALERVDWDCYVITMPMGEWSIRNPHVKFIYLSPFKGRYQILTKKLYFKGLLNPGANNVILGVLYFAITYGYKNIALLGCPYRQLDYEMKSDGMHLYQHMHYYDEKPSDGFISYEDLNGMKEDFSLRIAKRSVENIKSLLDIKEYAKNKSANIVNYSEGSQFTMLQQGRLEVEEGQDISFISEKNYRYK